MSLRLLRLSLVTCLIVSAVHGQTPPAEPPPANPADELVGPIKLPDADIDTVLGLLEIYTDRSVLRPQQLPTATYRLVIDRKIPKSEAILALETILGLNQVGVAPLGDKFLKVVALSQVKTEAPQMITGSTLDLPASGRIATKLFQLNFLRVNEFVPQITQMMSPGVANGIVVLEKANAALITDSISNLQRVEMLLQQLDAPMMTGLTPKFYPLHNAKASDVVNKLRAMFQGPLQGQLGSAISYSADDRTNQIVLLADQRQQPLFDELIEKLDSKGETNTRNEVIYLKHASAKEVAPLISQLVSGQTAAFQKTGAAGVRPPGSPAAGAPGAPTPAPTVEAVTGIVGENTNEFSSLMTIGFDDRSNAVVVSGTVDDIRLVRELVDKIDILLAQVRIEVVIAEVTLSNNDRTGLASMNLTVNTTENGRGTHVTNFGGDIGGWNITEGVVNPLAFKAAMGNVGDRSNVKILSAPTIVTTHNKEAQILVGTSQPIITGTTNYGSTIGVSGSTSTDTVTYKDIAIQLKVTPLIGDDGSIQLKIEQKVDDIFGNISVNGNPQPIIGRREASSFVNVQDGQMIVLGGLQRTKNSRGRTKLGFIYEIPILSHLLGARDNSVERTELLLFIRPHVIPVESGTADASKTINSLSNKEQVNQYLSDPSKVPSESLNEKLK
ncbi:MAG: secretin N-terminal domain-containing protein [Opitutus sp.]